jgi:ABC-type sugar transport system ATPase subunit
LSVEEISRFCLIVQHHRGWRYDGIMDIYANWKNSKLAVLCAFGWNETKTWLGLCLVHNPKILFLDEPLRRCTLFLVPNSGNAC